jgi:hypothetical protein
MDEGRSNDLDHLTMVLHNPDETARHKRQARRAIDRIKKQMQDPTIKRLRERLIRAQQASDTVEAEKISNELQDYMKRTYGRG